MRWNGRFWPARCGTGAIAALLVASSLSFTAALPGAVAHAAEQPTNDEVALLVLTNQARAEPSAYGVSNPPTPPLVWNDDLWKAARAHSDDMAENGCFGHDSCNGQSWVSRVGRYYTGWRDLGENVIGLATDPRDMQAGWMGSAEHRANILDGSFADFGAGISAGMDGFGPTTYATEDFGSRGLRALNSIPTIPAGTVLPRIAGSESRQLLVNYYHYQGGAPQDVHAMLGSSCVHFALVAGKADQGTYAASRSVAGNGCVPLVFEAVRSDGTVYRYPTSGAILVGVGSAGAACDERTTSLPTADCGTAGPTPTPVPDVRPTPADTTPDLSSVKVAMHPGPKNKSKGQVSLQATLVAPADFDPSANDIHVTISLENGGEWTQTLPASCGDAPCMSVSQKGTTYRGKYGKSLTASFVKTRKGPWHVRLSARSQTLDTLAAGPVDITVSTGNVTVVESLRGHMKESSLIAP